MSQSLAKLIGALVASAGLAWTGAAVAEPFNAAALGAGYSSADAPLGAPISPEVAGVAAAVLVLLAGCWFAFRQRAPAPGAAAAPGAPVR